ncbi:MAG: DUF3313 domain-containing protein [Deltaproteobacteria bacterium]|nr:MAG: DUF3313 domain-containing protein [Deltaproteobacteria bacterium]
MIDRTFRVGRCMIPRDRDTRRHAMYANRRKLRWVAGVALASLALASAGCGIIRPTRGRHFEEVERSGFLGDYSELGPREGFEAQEVYVNSKAQWPHYDAIYIQSVTLWVNDPDKKPDPKDRRDPTAHGAHRGEGSARRAQHRDHGGAAAARGVHDRRARHRHRRAGRHREHGRRSRRRDHQPAARGGSRFARGHEGRHADAFQVGRRAGDLRSLGRASARLLRGAGGPADSSAEEELNPAAVHGAVDGPCSSQAFKSS